MKHLYFILFLALGISSASAKENYTLEEVPSAVRRLNAELLADEQIRDRASYEAALFQDPRLPSWDVLIYRYKKEYGNTQGLSDFIFDKRKLYTLEEVPQAVIRLNAKLSKREQMESHVSSYEAVRFRDPRLPSWSTLAKWYEKKYGAQKGLLNFIFGREFYSLEEVPAAVRRLNAKLPKEKQIRSGRSYIAFHSQDPRLPSWDKLVHWYVTKHGNKRGVSNFILNKREPYTLEETPQAVIRLNAKLSADEQIRGRTSYEAALFQDPRLPSWHSLGYQYRKKHGHEKGLSDFIFGREFYSLEEVPLAVRRLNAELPADKQIRSEASYTAARRRSPMLPSWDKLARWYRTKHGNEKGLIHFIFGRKFHVLEYTLEEVPSAVRRLNAELPKEKQIRGSISYEAVRSQDSKLPSWHSLAYWYQKKHGDHKGLTDFVLGRNFYALEEIPSAVRRLNAKLPKEKQIRGSTSYEAARSQDPRLPSWRSIIYRYQKKHGNQKGLTGFVLGRNCEQAMARR